MGTLQVPGQLGPHSETYLKKKSFKFFFIKLNTVLTMQSRMASGLWVFLFHCPSAEIVGAHHCTFVWVVFGEGLPSPTHEDICLYFSLRVLYLLL